MRHPLHDRARAAGADDVCPTAEARHAGLPGAVSTAGAADQSTRPAKLARIKKLAAEAYVWVLAGEFTWRFAKYNTALSAPINALTYGQSPAAWNNTTANAGESSAIGINGFTDFS